MNLMQASDQWAKRPADQRFETLTALRSNVHGRRERSRSLDVEISGLKAALSDDEKQTLTINGKIAPSEPSHWAFGQFSGLLKAPAAYLRTLPKPLLVQNLNHGLQTADRTTVKFMTVAPPDEAPGLNTLQAVTSETYGRIWDADVIDAVLRVVDRSGGKFHNPLAYTNGFGGEATPSGLYASDHDVFMFLIDGGSRLEAGPRAKLNRGFFVWNSETGARTFGLMTFLFNEVCGNHIVWGAQEINQLIIRHSSGGPARFDKEAAPALLDYSNASMKPEEDAIRKAQDMLLPRMADNAGTDSAQLAAMVAPFKITRTELIEAERFAKSEEGEMRTLWQLVQGLTAYARGFDWIDSRVDLERRAGALLNLAK